MNTFFFDDVQYPEGLFGGKDFFNPIIYSTEEREVGVWIDNKPLYQKTILAQTSTTSNSIEVLHNISNLGEVVHHETNFRFKTNDYDQRRFIPQFYSDMSSTYSATLYYVDSTKMYLYYGDWLKSMPSGAQTLKITLWYTKDSDTAGSGLYNTLGVPNVHYTTDEQVIGTWFGETLYEKIINFDYNNIQSRTSSGCEIYINVPNIKDTKDSVILLEGGIIQFPYFANTSIFIGGFTQTETDTLHISLRYSSSVYNELNAYLTDCRVKLQYTKTS